MDCRAFQQLLEVGQPLKHRGPGRFLDTLSGVLVECGVERVRIAGFEENQELGRVAAPVPFDGVVNAIFPGNPFKFPDRGVGQLNVGHALILPNELFHRLLAVRRDSAFALLPLLMLDLLPVSHVPDNGILEHTPGELASVDNQREGFVFHFFLHQKSPFSAPAFLPELQILIPILTPWRCMDRDCIAPLYIFKPHLLRRCMPRPICIQAQVDLLQMRIFPEVSIQRAIVETA